MTTSTPAPASPVYDWHTITAPDMAWNVSSLSMAYSLSAVVGPVMAGGGGWGRY